MPDPDSTDGHRPGAVRTRWAAIGAAVAITLGAGGIGLVGAAASGDVSVYTAITPCRVADTRPEPEFNVGERDTPLGPADTHTIRVRGDNGQCAGIPADAAAVGLNVTPVGPTLDTFLTIWPDGERPNASSLNPSPSQPPTPNAVTVELSDAGSFEVYNYQGNVHVVVDVVGFYRDYGDHRHDDRYYTEDEVDALVDAAVGEAMATLTAPPGVAEPDLGDYHGAGWLFDPDQGAWRVSSASYTCLAAELDIPAGSVITTIDLSVAATELAELEVFVHAIDQAAAGEDWIDRSLLHFAQSIDVAASAPLSFTPVRVVNVDEFPGDGQFEVLGDGYDIVLRLCSAEKVSLAHASVAYTPPT